MGIYNYNTENGLIIPDVSTIKEDVQNEWIELTGNHIIPDPSSLEGRLIDAEVMARVDVVNLVCYSLNQFNPNFSENRYLDDVCALVGVKRSGSQKSYVTCKIDGVSGTIIPKGTQVSDKSQSTIWEFEHDTKIRKQSQIVTLASLEAGQFLAKKGEVTEIKNKVLGWKDIENLEDSTVGRLQQSDVELRKKRRSELHFNAKATAGAIMSKVGSVDGVSEVSFYENYTSNDVSIGKLVVEKKSTYLCVSGGSDYDIADAYQIRSAGCGYSASKQGQTDAGKRTEVIWKDSHSRQEINVLFDRPAIKKITVLVTVKGSVANSVTDAVKETIMLYSKEENNPTNGFCLGVDLSAFEIGNHIINNVPMVFVSKVEIAVKGDKSQSCETITNEIYEKAVIENENDIIVTVI